MPLTYSLHKLRRLGLNQTLYLFHCRACSGYPFPACFPRAIKQHSLLVFCVTKWLQCFVDRFHRHTTGLSPATDFSSSMSSERTWRRVRQNVRLRSKLIYVELPADERHGLRISYLETVVAAYQIYNWWQIYGNFKYIRT